MNMIYTINDDASFEVDSESLEFKEVDLERDEEDAEILRDIY